VVVRPALFDDTLKRAAAKAAFGEVRQTDKRIPGAAKQELEYGLNQAQLVEKLSTSLPCGALVGGEADTQWLPKSDW